MLPYLPRELIKIRFIYFSIKYAFFLLQNCTCAGQLIYIYTLQFIILHYIYFFEYKYLKPYFTSLGRESKFYVCLISADYNSLCRISFLWRESQFDLSFSASSCIFAWSTTKMEMTMNNVFTFFSYVKKQKQTLFFQ